MFCPNCGADNDDDDAKICQRCGFDIEHYDAMANVNFDYSFDDDEDEQMGNSSLAVSTSNSTIASNVSSNTSSNISSSSNVATENTVNNTNTANVPYANGPIKIQKLSISTAREIEALTYIKMYVGTQFAGKAVKVSSVFSNKNNVMCEETILTETVSSDGYVNFASTKAFAKFPDHGIIKVYNADGTLSDSKEITIVPRAGTQNFQII